MSDENDQLISACRKNNFTEARRLLSTGRIDVNYKNKNGYTALMWTCDNDLIDMARVLLQEFGAGVDVQDNGGKTALMWVCQYGHINFARMLLQEFGADVNLKNNYGYTALMFACQEGNMNIARMLLQEFGTDVNLKSKAGMSALEVCKASCKVELETIIAESRSIPSQIKPASSAIVVPPSPANTAAVSSASDSDLSGVNPVLGSSATSGKEKQQSIMDYRFETVLAERDSLETELSRIRAQLMVVGEERNNAQTQLRVNNEERNRAVEERDRVAEEHTRLQIQLRTLSEELNSTQGQLRVSNEERDRVAEEHNRLQTQLRTLSEELNNAQAQLRVSNEERDRAGEERNDARTQLLVNREERNRLEAQLIIVSEERDRAFEELNRIRTEDNMRSRDDLPPFRLDKRYLLRHPCTGVAGTLYRCVEASPLFEYAKRLCRTGGMMSPRQMAVQEFRLVAVDEVVHYPHQVAAFEARLETIDVLRGTGGSHFNFASNQFVSDKLAVLTTMRDAFHERAAGEPPRRVNTLYCFHGPRREHVESICRAGLVDVRAMDAGFFGSGCYTTLNIEYAVRYAYGDFDNAGQRRAPSADGRYPVVMFAAAVGMAYPITPTGDYGHVAGSPEGYSDYFGRPLRPGFDLHCICVSEVAGMQAVARSYCQYMELVMSQQSDLLPIAVLWFERL